MEKKTLLDRLSLRTESSQLSLSTKPDFCFSGSSGQISRSSVTTDTTSSSPDGPLLDSDDDDPDCDQELLSDVKPEDRLMDPRHYFKKLEDLEATVFDNSAVRYYRLDQRFIYQNWRRPRTPQISYIDPAIPVSAGVAEPSPAAESEISEILSADSDINSECHFVSSSAVI